MTTRPNLFDYATKELSQDAMICWLLKWAASEHHETDRDLSNVGRRLVAALLKKHDASLDDAIDTVEVCQQWRHIDVLARINGTHTLLIEDKTSSTARPGQLEEYYEAVKGRASQGSSIYPIYFKTGNYRHGERDDIEKERCYEGTSYRYRMFDRGDFLQVLKEYAGANASLKDFRDHLQNLEDKTNSYKRWTEEQLTPSGEWEPWQGFFKCIEGELARTGFHDDLATLDGERWAGWGYVPNKAGGFLGCWWGGDHPAYLQLEVAPKSPLEDQKLCFKVAARDKSKAEQTALKNDWYGRIEAAGDGLVRRPPVMRIGKAMTVGIWKGIWMAFNADGQVDIEQTIGRLREAEAVLAKAVDTPSQSE